VDYINEMWNKINKGINEAAGKIIGKEERPQINSWLEEKDSYTSNITHNIEVLKSET
jgi:hypothetical protein